jgi:NAD(P)H-flavin reductase
MGEYVGEITRIVKETHDVNSYLVKTDNIDFIAGQYALVSVVDHPELSKKKIPITYSNAPGEQVQRLTVKAIGEATKDLTKLKEGDKLKLDGPKGKTLNFDDSVKEDVVFLAGGSGITPFMSAIEYAISRGMDNRLALIFGNRTEEDIIFLNRLNQIDSEQDNIKVIHFLESGDDQRYEMGFITKDKLLKHVESPKEKLWYICGPPAMNDACYGILEEMGIPKERIRREKWEIAGKKR